MQATTCAGMEVINLDDTSQRIIDAAMHLIRDKGYIATTTKDIAKKAGVNECTLFRKFQNKKDIVLKGISQEKWRGNISANIFKNVVWDLKPDLEMFMREYMNRITVDFVNLSIGLRAPQIYEETAPFIMKIPQTFLSSLISYFEQMKEKEKIIDGDFENMAMTFFSATFGYTFLHASFGEKLSTKKQEDFIKESVKFFIQGISF